MNGLMNLQSMLRSESDMEAFNQLQMEQLVMADIRDNCLATLENMGSQMELEDTVFGIESDDVDDSDDDDDDDMDIEDDDDAEALDEAMVDLDLESGISTSLENTTPPPTTTSSSSSSSSSSSDMQKQRQQQLQQMQQQSRNKPDTDSATESDINKIPEETEENAGRIFASMSENGVGADVTAESCINEFDVLF